MTKATAKLMNYRQAPRKVRLVADLIKGKSVPQALSILAMLPKRASGPLAKLLRSALSNAKGASADSLFIEKITVNKGTVLKRFMPRARGSASPILKRNSHVALTLSQRVVSG